MATTVFRGFGRHQVLWTRVLMAALLTIVAAESVLLYQQHQAGKSYEAQSGRLLNTFLQRDTSTVSTAPGVSIRLQNVRFKWSSRVYVDASDMALRAEPIQGQAVKFDDPSSFVLSLQQSTVLVHPDVLEGMMNESIFNYPGSKLRDLKVKIIHDDNTYPIEITGKLRMGLWITFQMVSHLTVDRPSNTLVMDVDRVKVLGFLPATKLIQTAPFHLEKLISLPPNQSMIVSGNRIMVKPFGLFPPPRVNGTLASVTTDANGIRLGFAGRPIDAPKSTARNYVYLRHGNAQFGNFRTLDTDILIVDRNQSTLFQFSVTRFNDLIPKSDIEVHDTRSVKVAMPDYAS
jgi:hypothetical protein